MVTPRLESRRSFSLIELLIAVALVVAASAVVLPVLLPRLEEGTYAAAEDLLVDHLALARTTALQNGRSIEVRYVAPEPDAPDGPRPAHLESLWFDLDATVDDGDDGSRRIPEGWAFVELPRGVEMRRGRPVADAAVGDALRADEERPPGRIAVYLADGSALFAPTSYVVDADLRASRLEIDDWTGLAQIERIVITDDAPDEDDEEAAPDEELDELGPDARRPGAPADRAAPDRRAAPAATEPRR